MKYRLMDILACPYDKEFPLKLIVIEEKLYPERKYEWDRKPFCEEYCAFKKVFIKDYQKPEELPCEECIKHEVVTGILYCSKCGRWFPIKEEIPIMLPDELRSVKEDIEFLESIRDRLLSMEPELGKKILEEGKPYNLSSRSSS